MRGCFFTSRNNKFQLKKKSGYLNRGCIFYKTTYTVFMSHDTTEKNITLDDLAGMVARGFVSIENRIAIDLGEVNKRLDNIEIRLDSVETRLDSVETRLDSVEQRLERIENRHERRIDVLESRVVTLKSVLENETEKPIMW